jgi:magnesium-transporting ATPase (P-type)
MTGESDEVKKDTYAKCLSFQREKESDVSNKTQVKLTRAHDLPSPVLLSGTAISSGEGKMLCIMVGDDSAIGDIIKKLVVRPQPTPLQEKLEQIATDIGKLGTYVALLTIHVLLARFFIEGLIDRSVDLFGGEQIPSIDQPANEFILIYLKKLVTYVIIGVAIIVVAVPEGLPLAVMISLAYSIEKMLKDNNDVKRLASCEIMGGANQICSDKTGTLTLN